MLPQPGAAAVAPWHGRCPEDSGCAGQLWSEDGNNRGLPLPHGGFDHVYSVQRLANTPSFPECNHGKMTDAWIKALKSVAAENTGTKTAGPLTEFLEKTKDNGDRLAPQPDRSFQPSWIRSLCSRVWKKSCWANACFPCSG